MARIKIAGQLKPNSEGSQYPCGHDLPLYGPRPMNLRFIFPTLPYSSHSMVCPSLKDGYRRNGEAK